MLNWIIVVLVGCAPELTEPIKPHHTKDGFKNQNIQEKPRFLAFLKWRWQRIWKNVPSPEAYQFPLAKNDPEFLRNNREKTTITWIGHATILLQLDGKNILTDPQFSNRASPIQWAGPKRIVPPGIPLEQLPPIDMVVISHDHYDSLDDGTIRKLRERGGGNQTVFFVPLGFSEWLADRGILNVVETDWWETHKRGNLSITATPMQHWSKRSLFSRNKTLWAGWVVRSDHFSFFFAGDSGYGPHFKEIGERLGPFDLSAIPIGAYEPRWFMKNHHMNPDEAVKVHNDARSRKSVAMHWGTFILTDEPLDEPPKLLRQAMKANSIADTDFLILKHGETIVIK
jgi:L-ascorbate metabolism protein UlaG (beta-lactamase superfamily)